MRRRPLTGAGSIVQSVRSAQGAEVVRRHGKQRPSFRSEVKDVPRTPTRGCRENFQTYTYDEGGGSLRAAGDENLT